MKKVSELEGHELNCWVAKALGYTSGYGYGDHAWLDEQDEFVSTKYKWRPSNDWSQCGPLIEKFKINLLDNEQDGTWSALIYRKITLYNGIPYMDNIIGVGSTVFVAICRAVVENKFGEEVDDE